MLKTSLFIAVVQNDVEKIDLIIQHLSFDKIKSQLKMTISISIQIGNKYIFKQLSKLDDESININDPKNKSLLYHSIFRSNTELLDEILNDPKFDSKKTLQFL